MTNKALSDIIYSQLSSLITSDYVLWGLPDYRNEGDVLIWQGTREFLKQIPHRCLDLGLWNDYRHPHLDTDTVILISGGGFFGDIWRKAWEYVMEAIARYPENPIIILPQSIHYQSTECLSQDLGIFKRCKRLTICARDEDSFSFAANNFGTGKVLLLPDMAFCMTIPRRKKTGDGILYLKRTDKEAVQVNDLGLSASVISDWPSINGEWRVDAVLKFLHYIKYFWKTRPYHSLAMWYVDKIYRPVMVKNAIAYLYRFDEIYTTRLHGLILAALLGIPVHFIDNNYGKLSAFYKTWLQDRDNIKEYV